MPKQLAATRKWIVHLKDQAETHREVLAEEYELLDGGALEFYNNHPKHAMVTLFAAGVWSYVVTDPVVSNG